VVHLEPPHCLFILSKAEVESRVDVGRGDHGRVVSPLFLEIGEFRLDGTFAELLAHGHRNHVLAREMVDVHEVLGKRLH